MPVFSDNSGLFRTNKMRIGRYKNTPLWLFLMCLIIGAAAISSLIMKSFQTDNKDSMQSGDLATKIIENLNKNQRSFRVNFLLGNSDSELMPDASIKGKIELNKHRQPFNLEFTLVDAIFANNKPTLKIMPQSQSYFLKPNITHEHNPFPEPLVLLTSIPYYQGLTKNIHQFYQLANQPHSHLSSPTIFKKANQHLSDALIDKTKNRWLKIEPDFVNYLVGNNSPKMLDLCFLIEGVYFDHIFWNFENYSVNNLYQPTIELKFNQSKFTNIIKSNPKHNCFKQLANDQIREATINRLKDLKILVSVNPSSYLPQSIVVSRHLANTDNQDHQHPTYQARFDFSFLADGINSSEPTDYIHISQLIQQLDRQAGNFLKSNLKR